MSTDDSKARNKGESDTKLSDDNKEFLVYQVTEAAKEKVISWAKWVLGFGVVILALFGIQYQISLGNVNAKIEAAVSDRIDTILKDKSREVDDLSKKMLDKHIESLTATLTESSRVIQNFRTESSGEHQKLRKEVTDLETEAIKLRDQVNAIKVLLTIDNPQEFAQKVKIIKDSADDIGATNLVGLTNQIAKLEQSLNENRAAIELSAKTVDSRINGLEYSPPGHFLSCSQIVDWLSKQLESGDSVLHALLIFAKDNQRTWMMTTARGRMYAVLNNKDKIPSAPLVDARISDLTKVEHGIGVTGAPILDIGIERLLYSPQLFPSTDQFLKTVRGVLHRTDQ